MGKSLFIYDRLHNKLDEITTFDNLVYGWTLNDVDTLEFQLALSDPKCTEANTQYFNHIEIWDDATNMAVWGGQIWGRAFSDAKLKLNCLSYEALLKSRRLRAKNYGTLSYGALTSQIITDTNAISATGVTIGSVATGALQTTRLVTETEMLLDKIKDFNGDANYDWDVDVNRQYNFYLRKGADKPRYVLTYGDDADNIIVAPERAEDVMSMANAVYSETDAPLTSLTQDTASQTLYGLVEGVFTANEGVSVQSTLDTQTSGDLQRRAYPINSFTITARDSLLCPFSDLIVGDAVTVRMIPYFDFSALMRIIRMVHDENTGTRDITFGTIIFRPQPPTKRLYKYWG